MSHIFYKLNKSENFVPGFIYVLHTFGRPLEWNPQSTASSQRAASLTEVSGGLSGILTTLTCARLSRKLLNEMEKRIGPSFKKTKALIYRKDKNGFYVYAKPALSNTRTVIKYIICYLGRPVIALSRIDSYDGENVTFHYNRHEDNAFIQKTIPAIDFIKLLIQHILEWNFKMTRYYGLYARHRANDPSPGVGLSIPQNTPSSAALTGGAI